LAGRIPAGGLDALQVVEGAVEGALVAGFVARQGGESVRATAIVLKYIGETVVGGEVAVVVVDIFGVVDQAQLEEAGFHGADAGEAPGGHDDLVDQEGFQGAGGLKLFLEGGLELVELLAVLDGNDGALGGEAVLGGVAAGGGLALGGFGAGGLEGVAAIGFDLFLGCHGAGVSFQGRFAP